MMVCHCNGVSDRAIRQAVRNGASTRSEVARACGAGSRCGGCLRTVSELIRHEGAHPSDRVQDPAPAPNANS
ncbi:(2Fe-2S)-binding protein [Myxococcota bacterium]|nr:(2Fe-2S)-binding protein [Myxococcota bacterium]